MSCHCKFHMAARIGKIKTESRQHIWLGRLSRQKDALCLFENICHRIPKPFRSPKICSRRRSLMQPGRIKFTEFTFAVLDIIYNVFPKINMALFTFCIKILSPGRPEDNIRILSAKQYVCLLFLKCHKIMSRTYPASAPRSPDNPQ